MWLASCEISEPRAEGNGHVGFSLLLSESFGASAHRYVQRDAQMGTLFGSFRIGALTAGALRNTAVSVPTIAQMKIVALEEHFATPELIDAWQALDPRWQDVGITSSADDELGQRLVDLDTDRIAAMDGTGI